VALLVVAFLLQLTNTLWPMRIKDFSVDRLGAVLTVALTLLAGGLSWCVSNVIAAHSTAAARAIVMNNAT